MRWKKVGSNSALNGVWRWLGHRVIPFANVPRLAARASSLTLLREAPDVPMGGGAEAFNPECCGTGFARPPVPFPFGGRRVSGAGDAYRVRNPRRYAYLLLRKLFFISLSSGCNLPPPMRKARQVANTSITIKCIRRDVIGLYRS